MIKPDGTGVGRFCWLDLAATDAMAATAFYRRVFGWQAIEQAANGGTFTRLALQGSDVGSLYQLTRQHSDQGVPSHWTPYVRVDDIDAAARRVMSSGGRLIVAPFAVSGVAHIALALDAVGAVFGLWHATAPGADRDGGRHG